MPELAGLGAPSLRRTDSDFAARSVLLSMRELAKSLGATAGRKTLIMFSAGFPLNAERQSELTATIDALNKANVAVYPVDVRGLGVPQWTEMWVSILGTASPSSPFAHLSGLLAALAYPPDPLQGGRAEVQAEALVEEDGTGGGGGGAGGGTGGGAGGSGGTAGGRGGVEARAREAAVRRLEGAQPADRAGATRPEHCQLRELQGGDPRSGQNRGSSRKSIHLISRFFMPWPKAPAALRSSTPTISSTA